MSARKHRQIPAKRLAYLESKDAVEKIHPDLRRREVRELHRRRATLERDTPSSTWADAVWSQGEKLPTGWVRCRCCERPTPPIYLTSQGACQDCVYDNMPLELVCLVPSSPSGQAIRYIAAMKVKIRI